MERTADKEPLTLKEAKKIQNWSERIFAIAVCSIPHLEVIYEPARFVNKQGVTVPDFLIRNRRRGKHATSIYIEVTGAKKLDGHRKKKQKRVMRTASVREGLRYLQLPRDAIENISCGKQIEVKEAACKRLKKVRNARTR